MTEKFQKFDTRRKTVKLNTKYKPKTQQFNKFFLYNTLKFYNELDSEMLDLSKQKFKKELKQHFQFKMVDTMD